MSSYHSWELPCPHLQQELGNIQGGRMGVEWGRYGSLHTQTNFQGNCGRESRADHPGLRPRVSRSMWGPSKGGGRQEHRNQAGPSSKLGKKHPCIGLGTRGLGGKREWLVDSVIDGKLVLRGLTSHGTTPGPSVGSRTQCRLPWPLCLPQS